MNVRYFKMVLEQELYNATHSVKDISDHATKEEVQQYVNVNVLKKIDDVLKEFDISDDDTK